MGGGLMQLVAYGAQDIYLTGNPQITFFKVVYRRHTNFAMEAIEQVFNGVAQFGNKVVCTIARNGDLVGRMYLEIDVNGKTVPGSQRNGHKMIKYAEIEIGGQKIDKHYGEWLDIWNQLSCPSENLHKLYQMVNGDLVSADSDSNYKYYIPLQFWFNRNPGLALPLIALQYHEVKVCVEFESLKNIRMSDSNNVGNSKSGISGFDNSSNISDVNIQNCCLFCDYIFLDTDERRRFAQVSHEYLIEQLQTTGTCSYSQTTSKVNINLNFNHPVKELVWIVQNQSQKYTYNYTQSSDNKGGDTGIPESTIEFVRSAKIQLNGHDRFRERQGSYFRCVQPYQHHSGLNSQAVTLGSADDAAKPGENNDEFGYIYTYSFALKPEEHQPSGTCNFSRIDNAVLNMTLQPSVGGNPWTGNLKNNIEVGQGGAGINTDKDVRVYAINYNVLRIMSGMGGLAYSN